MQSLARRLATAPRQPWPERPVPLALVITELDVGGAEKALVSLVAGLNRQRWHPRVIALGPEAPMAAPIRAAEVEVVCLSVDPRRPLRAVTGLASSLREQKPALVQSFLFHANVATRVAAPLAGRPWVLGGLRVAERQKRWHVWLERLSLRLASGSVCVSEGVRRFALEKGGWPAERLTVIGNSIDVAPLDAAVPIDRQSLGVPEGACMALFVGRLNVQKGLPTLLDAAAKVIATRPDWHLVLAGDGPEGTWLASRLASEPDLVARVHPLGLRADVPELLKAADVLVLPSLWEGMPNAVLEAMAAGRAVVATAVEGTEELVVPHVTGWLVPPGDANALADALLNAAADPDSLRRLGQAARTRVENEFSPARTILAYERLWARILGLEEPDSSHQTGPMH
jgi:starch synthase (maltosyl-transferring)